MSLLSKLLASRHVAGILHEAGRHLLRRPVVGTAAICKTADGKCVLIRRGDTGTWALPGGTLEWGETLRDGLARELLEEAGIRRAEFLRVVGVYSRPDRDPRFHGVTIVVEMTVEPPSQPPKNPLEITEVGLFAEGDLPAHLAMGQEDMLRDARTNGPVIFE
jgi:8-oxo-dGTP diphosphatase